MERRPEAVAVAGDAAGGRRAASCAAVDVAAGVGAVAVVGVGEGGGRSSVLVVLLEGGH